MCFGGGSQQNQQPVVAVPPLQRAVQPPPPPTTAAPAKPLTSNREAVAIRAAGTSTGRKASTLDRRRSSLNVGLNQAGSDKGVGGLNL